MSSYLPINQRRHRGPRDLTLLSFIIIRQWIIVLVYLQKCSVSQSQNCSVTVCACATGFASPGSCGWSCGQKRVLKKLQVQHKTNECLMAESLVSRSHKLGCVLSERKRTLKKSQQDLKYKCSYRNCSNAIE